MKNDKVLAVIGTTFLMIGFFLEWDLGFSGWDILVDYGSYGEMNDLTGLTYPLAMVYSVFGVIMSIISLFGAFSEIESYSSLLSLSGIFVIIGAFSFFFVVEGYPTYGLIIFFLSGFLVLYGGVSDKIDESYMSGFDRSIMLKLFGVILIIVGSIGLVSYAWMFGEIGGSPEELGDSGVSGAPGWLQGLIIFHLSIPITLIITGIGLIWIERRMSTKNSRGKSI